MRFFLNWPGTTAGAAVLSVATAATFCSAYICFNVVLLEQSGPVHLDVNRRAVVLDAQLVEPISCLDLAFGVVWKSLLVLESLRIVPVGDGHLGLPFERSFASSDGLDALIQRDEEAFIVNTTLVRVKFGVVVVLALALVGVLTETCLIKADFVR